MIADESCRTEILNLVNETYARLSTPGSNPAELMAHQEMAIAGSGLEELYYGPQEVRGLVTRAAAWGFAWTTGVFVRNSDGWQWRYFGGAQPQKSEKD